LRVDIEVKIMGKQKSNVELNQISRKEKNCDNAGNRVKLNNARQRRNLKKSRPLARRPNFHVNISMAGSENSVFSLTSYF
jgi:hypothetical protein